MSDNRLAAFAVDAQGQLFLIDGAAQELFGYELSDLPANYLGFVAPEDLPRAVETFQKVFEEHKAAEVTVTAIHKDGRRIPVRVFAAPDRDTDRTVVGIVGTFELV